jgi:hypothetical protein
MVHRVRCSMGLALALGISSLMAGSRAEAGFLLGNVLSFEIEDTITNPPSTFGPIQFLVNNTVELGVNTAPAVPVNIEVDDTTITFTYTSAANFNAASFNGYIFTAISPALPPFGSITIDPATTLAGFNASDLSLDSTHFFINVAGLSTGVGTVLKLDVAPAGTAVPEPSSLALCGIAGLTCLATARARRKRPA